MNHRSRRLQHRFLIAAGLVAVVSVAAAAVVGPAPAKAAYARRHVHLLDYGNERRFASLTGQTGGVQEAFFSFKRGRELRKVIAKLGPVPMVALMPGAVRRVSATPEGIATGENDNFLFRLNRAIAAYRGPLFYLRPFPEMNGHWESNCAYNKDGTPRPEYDSTAWSRKAFARIAIIARGGTKAAMDAQLARLHLPPVRRRHGLPVTTPKLKMVWNPQGTGAPSIPGNQPSDYYPGDAYVDVVADDMYGTPRGAVWWAAQALYDSHPTKEFGFGEWGVWGIDDPRFIHEMGTFAYTHHRVTLLAFFNGKPRSKFDLSTKPKSARAYRRYIVPLGYPAVPHRHTRPGA